MKYQNTLQNGNKSTFIEVGTYSGDELTFDAKARDVQVGGQVVKFARASISLRMPHEITACGDNSGCVVGAVTQSLKIDFNVMNEEALDVLKAEVDRVFLLTKQSLVHGVLPPQYSSFESA